MISERLEVCILRSQDKAIHHWLRMGSIIDVLPKVCHQYSCSSGTLFLAPIRPSPTKAWLKPENDVIKTKENFEQSRQRREARLFLTSANSVTAVLLHM